MVEEEFRYVIDGVYSRTSEEIWAQNHAEQALTESTTIRDIHQKIAVGLLQSNS